MAVSVEPLSVDLEWTHTLTIGNSGTIYNGYREGDYGSITPDWWESPTSGKTLSMFIGNISSSFIHLKDQLGNGGRWDNEDYVWVWLEGMGSAYRLEWNDEAGNNRYHAESEEISQFLQENVGNNIRAVFKGGETPPYPPLPPVTENTPFSERAHRRAHEDGSGVDVDYTIPPQSLPSLYVNNTLAGGAASGPGVGSNPPTSHNLSFNLLLSQPIQRSGYSDWEINSEGDSGRACLGYIIDNLNPDLELDTEYWIRWYVTKVSGTGIVLDDDGGGSYTLLESIIDTDELGVPQWVGFRFTLQAGWDFICRIGTGPIGPETAHVIISHPQLYKVGEEPRPPAPTWGTPVDQDTDNAGHTYDVGSLVSGQEITYAQNLPAGFSYRHPTLTATQGMAPGSYTIENMIIGWNRWASSACPAFAWEVEEASVDITLQPEDHSAIEPEGHTFTCEGSTGSGADIYYQWYARRVGDTVWELPNLILSDVGRSDTNELVINSTTTVDRQVPIIEEQPEDTSLIEPEGGEFSVKARSDVGAALYYRWYARVTGTTDWLDPSAVLSDVDASTITQDTLKLLSTETT